MEAYPIDDTYALESNVHYWNASNSQDLKANPMDSFSGFKIVRQSDSGLLQWDPKGEQAGGSNSAALRASP
jgi:hypothetical protein